MSSRTTMPFPKVTIRAPSSSFVSVTNPGTRRVWSAPTSRSAAHAVSGLAAIRASLRMDAMVPPLLGEGRNQRAPRLGESCALTHSKRRNALVPPRRLLVGVTRAQDCHFVERPPDDLEAHREPRAREAAGQRERRKTGGVEGPGAANHRAEDRLLDPAVADVLLADGRGDDRRGRRDEHVDWLQPRVSRHG